MKLPQLSLRELFLLVVIAAMGCGWWVDRRRVTAIGSLWQKRAENLKSAIEERWFLFDRRMPNITVTWIPPDGNFHVAPSNP